MQVNKRAPSIATLLARRQREDAQLRAALEKLEADRAGIDAQIAEIKAMLGVAASGSEGASAPGSTGIGGGLLKCMDCGAHVPNGAHDACPQCTASPFEGETVLVT